VSSNLFKMLLVEFSGTWARSSDDSCLQTNETERGTAGTITLAGQIPGRRAHTHTHTLLPCTLNFNLRELPVDGIN